MSRTLNLVTRPYSTSNIVRINIYKTSDPLVVIASDEKQGPLSQEEWTFPGLEEGINYTVKILEISTVNGSTIQQYDDFTITVGLSNTIKVKKGLLLFVDIPMGMIINSKTGDKVGHLTSANTALFDGTSGSEDWRGWDIHLELIGAGTSKENLDYTWDKVTGILSSTNDFEEVHYYVEFEPQVEANVSPNLIMELFSSVKTITNDETLVAADAGKKILIKGSDNYLEATLPDIATVLENKPFYFESAKGNHNCASIISANANAIDWLEGSRNEIRIKPNESVTIYKQKIDDTTSVWRIHDSDGNFKCVGEFVSEYASVDQVLNKIALDNTVYNDKDEARLYYDYIVNLPPGEVVSFVDWGTGNNKYKFSLRNSNGEFHVPDLRDTFEKVTDGTRTPGSLKEHSVGYHYHGNGIADDIPNTFVYGGITDGMPGTGNGTFRNEVAPRTYQGKTGGPYNLSNGVYVLASTNTKTEPENIAVRKYIRT